MDDKDRLAALEEFRVRIIAYILDCASRGEISPEVVNVILTLSHI